MHCVKCRNFHISRAAYGHALRTLTLKPIRLKFVTHNHRYTGSIWGENDRGPAKWKHSRAQWPIHCEKCRNFPISRTACGDAFFTLTLRPIRLKFVTHNHRYMGSIWGENDRRPAKWKHSRAQWPIHWKKCPNSPSSSTACGDAFFTLTLRPIRLKFVTHNHRYMGSIRGENERGPAKWKRSRAQWPIHWKKCPNSPSSSTACGDAFFTLTLRPIPLTFVTRNDRHMCSISGENDPYPPEWPWLPKWWKDGNFGKTYVQKKFCTALQLHCAVNHDQSTWPYGTGGYRGTIPHPIRRMRLYKLEIVIWRL